jgi:hypothetical protein
MLGMAMVMKSKRTIAWKKDWGVITVEANQLVQSSMFLTRQSLRQRTTSHCRFMDDTFPVFLSVCPATKVTYRKLILSPI